MGIGEQFEFEKTGRIEPEPGTLQDRVRCCHYQDQIALTAVKDMLLGEDAADRSNKTLCRAVKRLQAKARSRGYWMVRLFHRVRIAEDPHERLDRTMTTLSRLLKIDRIIRERARLRGRAETIRRLAGELRDANQAAVNLRTARPQSEWHEDLGPVLWWRWPVCEPPFCGCPWDSDWPFDDDEEVRWTPIVEPDPDTEPPVSDQTSIL